MKYITIIMVLIVFWFLQWLGFSLLIQDQFFTTNIGVGNTSYILLDTSNINMTTDELTEQTSLRNFPSALKIMFGFRIPIMVGLPPIAIIIVSFMNWFAVILFGISLYRIINPLA